MSQESGEPDKEVESILTDLDAILSGLGPSSPPAASAPPAAPAVSLPPPLPMFAPPPAAAAPPPAQAAPPPPPPPLPMFAVAPPAAAPKPAPVLEPPKPAPIVEAPKLAPVVEPPKPAPVVEAPKPAPVVEPPRPALIAQAPSVAEPPTPTPPPKAAPAPPASPLNLPDLPEMEIKVVTAFPAVRVPAKDSPEPPPQPPAPAASTPEASKPPVEAAKPPVEPAKPPAEAPKPAAAAAPSTALTGVDEQIPEGTAKDQVRAVAFLFEASQAERTTAFVKFLDTVALKVSKKPMYLRRPLVRSVGPDDDPSLMVDEARKVGSVGVIALVPGLGDRWVRDLEEAASKDGLFLRVFGGEDLTKRSVAVDLLVDLMLLAP